jgi:hypothetical protein
MRKNYLIGMDVIGASDDDELSPVAQETNRAILIKVRNAAQLAKSQGAVATFAQALAPATVEAKVYDTMAQELRTSLRAKNVDATVTVVEPSAWETADGKHIWTDVGIGVGILGAAALMWRIFGGKKK